MKGKHRRRRQHRYVALKCAAFAAAGAVVGIAVPALPATQSTSVVTIQPGADLRVICSNGSGGYDWLKQVPHYGVEGDNHCESTGPSSSTTTTTTAGGAGATLHYTANGNFSGSTYEPGALGFNVADVSSNSATEALPAGVKGLEWIGQCSGATASFDATVNAFKGDAKVFGFYLMDEPTPSSCPAANLKAESDYIHANLPGTKTFIVEQDLNSTADPNYYDGYGPANSGVDLYGIDPYPCRTENPSSAPCSFNWINLAVAQAESTASGTNYYGETGPDPGIPAADIVPVFQAFGGGSWQDDGGGSYQLPTAAQEQQIMATWDSLVPSPVFDYAYSWGVQQSDTALSDAPASLQQVFGAHNS